MTINYTSLLGLAQPVTGTEAGTWGTVVNDQITALVEDAVANAATISVTAGNVTLSTTDGTSNQARMSALILTGTPGTTRNVVAPSHAKIYVVLNQSDSSVVIKGSATTGVTLASGVLTTVAWNGSDFAELSTFNSLTLKTALGASSGGTGQASYTAGDLLYASGTTALSKLTLGTTGKYLVAGASAPEWQSQSSSITYVIDGGGVVLSTGIQGDLTIPFACTINEWTLLADVSGSMVLDIWKDTYANYPPTVADTITGSAKPTITTSTKGQSSTLTGWTTSIAAGDILRFNIDSVTSLSQVTLSLKVTRT